MPLHTSSTPIQAVYVGNTPAQKAYMGTTQVWPATSLPPPMLAVAFNEGSGTTFMPTIGPGTGTITPGYGQWIPGPHGGMALGRYVTGPGGYDVTCAVLSDVSSLNTASWGGMTVMAWVKLYPETTTPRWPLALVNGGMTLDDYWMGWKAPYNSQGIESLVNGVSAFGSDAAPEGVWVHLCTTWDGSEQYVYSNAELVASSTVAGPLGSTTAILIGSTGFNYGAQGVDDLRIYNQALTQQQVAQLMNQSV